jgi:small subunit ribosomal protein S6
MAYYETVFIARQDLTDAQVKDLITYFSKIISDGAGKVHKTEHWGLRNFAYRINKSRRGHYVLIETDTPPAALLEMERQMRIHDDVIRYLSIREEKLSTGPSIIMDKSGRDDEEKKPYHNRNQEEKDAA